MIAFSQDDFCDLGHLDSDDVIFGETPRRPSRIASQESHEKAHRFFSSGFGDFIGERSSGFAGSFFSKSDQYACGEGFEARIRNLLVFDKRRPYLLFGFLIHDLI